MDKRLLAVTKESFDALLAWLDTDREVAGRKYETIRAGLIRILVSQGFSDADYLTDRTINIVIAKLPEIREDYVGEPARYFYAVARNVAHEARRRKEIATDNIPERPTQVTNTSDRYDCLITCLKRLSHEKSELILDYYLYEGRDKIEHHRRMARELGITDGALRTRAHHIRAGLEKCVLDCARNLDEKQKTSWSALLKRRQMTTTAIGKEQQP
jgi:DNA-directed RNA polymerase specialized sigma24 family protein